MSHQKRRLNQQAQHLIEYSVIIILVLAGIIISGPYVIRSWNARVKSWEDGVTESLQDPLLEAPADTVTIPGCDIVLDWGCYDIGGCCGLGKHTMCMDLDCAATERLETRTFTPLDCECYLPSPFTAPPTARCVVDCNCCTEWSPVPAAVNPLTDCGVNASPPCPDDYYRARRTCGDPTCPEGTCGPGDGTCPTAVNESDCFYDYALCHFECTGTPGPNFSSRYGDLCLGDDTGLPRDTSYSYVNPGGCTAGTQCEIQCISPFISYGSYCDCPPLTTYNTATDSCDAIRVFVVAINNGVRGRTWVCTRTCCGRSCYCCDGYWRYNTTTVDWSTTWCVPSFTVNSVTVTGVGCDNPGTPGNNCVVTLLP